MLPEAPAILVALEQSWLGAGIRQSVWIYPAANVAHVLTLTVLASAVSVMDLRILGAHSGRACRRQSSHLRAGLLCWHSPQ